jgi:hypothetical protein
MGGELEGREGGPGVDDGSLLYQIQVTGSGRMRGRSLAVVAVSIQATGSDGVCQWQ